MPVTLSIENAPDDMVAKLRSRAASHHRSMQGELMAILDEVTREPVRPPPDIIDRLFADVKAIGHPSGSEAVRMIREDRDSEDR